MWLKRRGGSGLSTMPSNIPKTRRKKMKRSGLEMQKHYGKLRPMRVIGFRRAAPTMSVSAVQRFESRLQQLLPLMFRIGGFHEASKVLLEKTLVRLMNRTNRASPPTS